MSREARRGAIIGMTFVITTCVAFGMMLFPLWPLQVRQAHQRWEQRRVRHYEVDVTWADGWSVGHARVEMRDGRFIAATDLDTGQPLVPSKRLAASYFASVDQLFALIEKRISLSMDWRIIVSRAHPLVEHWLKPCVSPLASVTFDDQLGYPREIAYNDSWCNETTFYTYSNVRLTNLTSLQ